MLRFILFILAYFLPLASCNVLASFPALYRVHTFYYLWYGEPSTTGVYQHWDHEVLSHWNPDTAQKYPQGMRFEPPDCLHSPFYPLRGPYSSASGELIRQHLQELEAYGVGVMVVSWWGPPWRAGSHDTQKVNTDERVAQVIREIEATGSNVRVAFHLEPYEGRTKETVREDLMYLGNKYKDSPAVLRFDGRIVYYVYDSYRLPATEWAQLLRADGGEWSVRGTVADGFFVGLWLNKLDGKQSLKPGGFDGAYTYFSSDTVSYGSNPENWADMMKWAVQRGLAFIPSVGPGYNDSKIRPWNKGATRTRDDGERYRQQWDKAIALGCDVVSVTSYNEWGEGTQIEPSVPRGTIKDCAYHDYEPHGPYRYMEITKECAERLAAPRTCSNSVEAGAVESSTTSDAVEAEAVGSSAGSDAVEAEAAGSSTGSDAVEAGAVGSSTTSDAVEAEAVGSSAGSDAAEARAVGSSAVPDAVEAETVGSSAVSDAVQAEAVGSSTGSGAVEAEAVWSSTESDAVEAEAGGSSTVSDAVEAETVGSSTVSGASEAKAFGSSTESDAVQIEVVVEMELAVETADGASEKVSEGALEGGAEGTRDT